MKNKFRLLNMLIKNYCVKIYTWISRIKFLKFLRKLPFLYPNNHITA